MRLPIRSWGLPWVGCHGVADGWLGEWLFLASKHPPAHKHIRVSQHACTNKYAQLQENYKKSCWVGLTHNHITVLGYKLTRGFMDIIPNSFPRIPAWSLLRPKAAPIRGSCENKGRLFIKQACCVFCTMVVLNEQTALTICYICPSRHCPLQFDKPL